MEGYGEPSGGVKLDRRYERMVIGGLTGITPEQHRCLLALGAIERQDHTTQPGYANSALRVGI